ncbi:uncharacterized protein LOC124204010 isoform X3 [Daphnia pulex]|uniref:uncharacterized protein LOC124204010 isoform X3 n=1 Tax=Daphnia pulex TaxID=6669 RepID=UPI001EDF4B19|nr:uncharacterized protein LOC124204010 isoform X3 [Daphnia pulex]
MGICLSWKLIVASILCLTISLASSELPDPLTDPASSEPREDKPPIKISSVQFESVCVNIYDSQITSNNKKIYFYSPMALLNHKNVVSIHNQTVTQGILSVSFTIWNQEVRNKVVQHLSQLLSQQIEPSHVKVLPFDSVRLTSKVQSPDFSLTNEWRLYDNQPSLRFTLICPTRKDCGRVKTQMLEFPKQFEHLQLEFDRKLNDDVCVNDDGVISEENKLQAQDNKETMKNVEVNFAKELIAIREVVQQKLEITQKELDATKTLLTSTRIELSQTKSTVDDQARKLNANSQRLNELKDTEDNLRKELGATLNLLETTTTNLASTTSRTNAVIADLTTKLNARTSEIVDIGKMPTSCADLQRTGHKLSGFFSVKGAKKMEMIYCNFNANQNDQQKWIGYSDVKSAPVHFHVTRNSSFNETFTPILFDLAVVNEGNAMDLTSGIFTAPRPGMYSFSFAGVAHLTSSSFAWFYSDLFLNGNRIGSSHVEERNGPVDQWSPMTLQSTLNLKKGDRVWVQFTYSGSYLSSYLSDSSSHFTHFTGFMLEEEIAASL